MCDLHLERAIAFLGIRRPVVIEDTDLNGHAGLSFGLVLAAKLHDGIINGAVDVMDYHGPTVGTAIVYVDWFSIHMGSEDIRRIVGHELVHVMQHERFPSQAALKAYRISEVDKPGSTYDTDPWEQEAYALECDVARLITVDHCAEWHGPTLRDFGFERADSRPSCFGD